MPKRRRGVCFHARKLRCVFVHAAVHARADDIGEKPARGAWYYTHNVGHRTQPATILPNYCTLAVGSLIIGIHAQEYTPL